MADANAGAAYWRLIADRVSEELNRTSFRLPQEAKLPLLLTLIAFVIAPIFGLAANFR
jgi:hypothetical protein